MSSAHSRLAAEGAIDYSWGEEALDMADILLVGLGGFAGAVGRYLIGGLVQRASGTLAFPWGTLAVNLTGCLLMGLLGGLVAGRGLLSGSARVFLMTGILGGFTTLSAMSYEAVALIRGGAVVSALLYAAISAAGGILLAAAGFWLTRA